MPHLTSLALINTRGYLILFRAYTPEANRSALDLFKLRVTSRARTEKGSSPVLLLEGITFLHIRHQDLYIVGTTMSNANPFLVFSYMSQLVGVLKSYIGHNFDENAIRGNFALVYELLDETVDYGVPQNCSADVLKLYINSGNLLTNVNDATTTSQLTEQITGKTDWRRSDIIYKKNEIYIDLLESVNVLIATDGTVLKADCSGEIKIKCYLSGMPECKLILNDKLFMDDTVRLPPPQPGVIPPPPVDIDDVSFHRCVRLSMFDANRSIVFVPPDGTFELMRYRIANNVTLPFRVIPIVDQSKLKVSYNVRVLCNFAPKVTANNVVLKIPVPTNTFKATCVCSFGNAKYEPAENAIIWRIRLASGEQEFYFNGVADLSPGTKVKPWSRPPILLQFRVNIFTASGLYVNFLKVVEASGYKPAKFVRYQTKAGSYQIRI
jgi:AP-2 complex subunit mu-1